MDDDEELKLREAVGMALMSWAWAESSLSAIIYALQEAGFDINVPTKNGKSSAPKMLGKRIEVIGRNLTGVAAREIASTGRHCAEAARARQIAMYLAHIAFAWPLARVAAAFGRDRSTISYACRRVEDLRDDAGFDTALQRMESCVRAAPFSGAGA